METKTHAKEARLRCKRCDSAQQRIVGKDSADAGNKRPRGGESFLSLQREILPK